MSFEQMEELSELSGHSMKYLQRLDEDSLWDLWDEVTNNIDPMEYLAMRCGAEDW